MFKEEWEVVVDQYNTMRDCLFTAEQSLFLAESQKYYLESELSHLKTFIQSKNPKFLPEYVEDYAPQPGTDDIDELGISEANCVMEKPLNFYGGYLMQMMYKKNEVLTNEVVQRLLRVITQLQEEKKLMEIDREAVNNVATLNFDLA